MKILRQVRAADAALLPLYRRRHGAGGAHLDVPHTGACLPSYHGLIVHPGVTMNRLDQQARQFVLRILKDVNDMTLATLRPDGYPQATTVSFANHGLALYVGVGLDSQKSHNIRQNNRVSLTVTAPYADWNHIQGLSMAGIAEIIHDREEMDRAAQCMLKRYPQIRALGPATQSLPWDGALFIRITPQVISILDYTKGFGHAELYSAAPA
jgi:general stress protein 26